MCIAQNKDSECPHQSLPRVVHSVPDTFKEHEHREETHYTLIQMAVGLEVMGDKGQVKNPEEVYLKIERLKET